MLKENNGVPNPDHVESRIKPITVIFSPEKTAALDREYQRKLIEAQAEIDFRNNTDFSILPSDEELELAA
jgi:hypothetical protein